MSAKPWLEWVFRPAIAALMFGAIVFSLVELARLFVLGYNGTFLTLFCTLVTAEGYYSYHLFRHGPLRFANTTLGRALEGAALFLTLRVGGKFSAGEAEPFANLLALDANAIVSVGLALFAWVDGWATAHDFDHLDEPPERGREYVSPADRLAGRFFAGGVLLLLTSGLARVGFAQVLNLSRASVAGPVLTVLVYIALGMVMLGQIRYTTLWYRWRQQKLTVAAGLGGRWARYSLAFLGIVALVAFLLPTSFTVGLLDSLRLVLSLFLAIAGVIWALLIGAASWLIAPLLPNRPEGDRGARPTPPPFPPPPPAAAGGVGTDWLAVLQSLLVWAVVLVLLVYLIRGSLLAHPRVRAFLGRLRPLAALGRLWTSLRRWLRGSLEAVRDSLPRRPVRRDARDGAARRAGLPFRPGALSPREQVLYYYLSIVRRAGRQGLPRRDAQTPAEYEATLLPRLPEAREDFSRLTGAFLEARYSRREVDKERTGPVRGHWQRVKAALQALGRGARERDAKGKRPGD